MPIEVGSAYVSFGADLSDIDRALSQLDSKMAQAMGRVGGSANEMAIKTGFAVEAFRKLSEGVQRAVSSGVQFLQQSVAVSARVMEMDFVLQNLGSRFGYSSEQMDSYVNGIRQMGITHRGAQDAVSQLMRYEIDLAKATDLARVAQDAAVLTMRNSSEVMQDLIYGITTQNNRVLRTQGLMVQTSEAMDTYAKSIDKTTKELSSQERVAAMVNAVLDAGKGIYGTYEAAMSSAGKQSRSLERLQEDLMELIGNKLYPAYESVIQIKTQFIKAMLDEAKTGGSLAKALENIGKALNVILPILAKVATEAVSKLVPAFAKVVLGVSKIIEAFTGLEPWAQKLLLVWVGLMAAMLKYQTSIAGLVTGKIKLGAELATVAAKLIGFGVALGPVVIAVTALVAAIGLLYVGFKKLQEVDARNKASFQEMSQQALETSSSFEEYEKRVKAAAQATGQMTLTQSYQIKEFQNLRAQYLSHTSQLNIAQKGVERLTEKYGQAGAAARKFGDDQMDVTAITREVAHSVEGLAESVSTVSAAFAKEFSAAWSDGWSQVQSVMTRHYKSLADKQSSAQLASIRSFAEYNAEREAALAAGDEKRVASLDASYQKQQILRELDAKLSLMQEQAKYKAELDEATKAFGQKMALWVMEAVMEQEIGQETASNILAGLRNALGAEVTAQADASLAILRIASAKADGVAGFASAQISSIEGIILAYKAEAEAAAMAAGQVGQVDWSRQEAMIQGAYGKIAAISVEGMSEVGRQTERRAEEVTLDIAQTLESLFNSIQNILETLSSELPSLPEATVGRWLDELYRIGQQVGQWMTSPAQQGLGEWTHWMATEMGPILNDWNGVMQTISGLLGVNKSIGETLAADTEVARLSVTQALDGILRYAVEARNWLQVNAARFGDVTEALKGQRVNLEKFAEGMGSIGSLIDLARSMSEGLSTRLVRARVAIGDVFNRLRDIALSSLEWLRANRSSLTEMIQSFDKDTVELLKDWNTALEPISKLLSLAQDTLELLSKRASDTRSSVANFLGALLRITEEGAAWIAANWPQMLRMCFMYEADFTDTLERWIAAFSPVVALLALARDTLGILASEAETAKTTLSDALSSLLDLTNEAFWWFVRNTAHVIATTQRISFASVYFEDWAKELGALSAVLRAGDDIAKLLADQASYSRGQIDIALDRLLLMTTDIATYLEGSRELSTITARLAVFRAELEEMYSALGPLPQFLGLAADLVSFAGEGAGKLRLDWDEFSGNLLATLHNILAFLDTSIAELGHVTAGISVHEDALKKLAEALSPLKDALSAAADLMALAAKEVPEISMAFDLFGLRLLTLLNSAIATLDMGAGLLADAAARLAVHGELLAQMSESLSPLVDALDLAGRLFDACAKEVEETQFDASNFFIRLALLVTGITAFLTTYQSQVQAVIAGIARHASLLLDMAAGFDLLSRAVSAGAGLLQAASAELEDGHFAVEDFFGKLDDFIGAITGYLDVNSSNVSASLTRLDVHSRLLEDLGTKLRPLQDAISAMSGVLNAAATDVATVQSSVRLFFDGVVEVMNQVSAYLDTSSSAVTDAISKLRRHEGTLKGLAEALAPLKAAFDLMLPILDAASKKAEQVNYAVAWIFDATMKVMNQVGEWLTNQGEGFKAEMIAFKETFGPSLDAFKAAIQPIAELSRAIDDVLSAGQALNPSRVNHIFLGFIKPTLLGLKEQLQYIKPQMEACLPLAESLGKIMRDIFDALAVSLQIIAYGQREQEGYEEGALSEVARTIETGIAGIQAQLESLYAYLAVTYRGQIAGLSYHAEAEAWVKTIASGITAGIGSVQAALASLSELFPHSPAKVGPLAQPLDTSMGADFIIGIAQGIRGAIPSLETALQQVPSAFARATSGEAALTYMNQSMRLMLDFIARWQDAFTHATAAPLLTTSERMATVAAQIKDVLDMFQAIAGYRTGDLGRQIRKLASDVELFVTVFSELDLVDTLGRLNQLEAVTRKLGLIFEYLGSSLGTMTALSEYQQVSAEAVRGAQQFILDLAAIGEQIRVASRHLQIYEWDMMVVWAQGLGRVMDSVSKAVVAITALSGYTGLSNAVAVTERFAADLHSVLVALWALFSVWREADVMTAANWAESTGAILDSVSRGFSFLTSLAEFRPLPDIVQRAEAFCQDISVILDALLSLGERYADMEFDTAWATAVGGMIGSLQGSFDFLSKLAVFSLTAADLVDNADALTDSLSLVFQALRDVGVSLGTDGLETARLWAEGAGAMFNALSSAFSFLEGVFLYIAREDMRARAHAFAQDVESIMAGLMQGIDSTSIGQEALDEAADWFVTAGRVVTALQGGFAFLEKLTDYSRVSNIADRMEAFTADVSAALMGLVFGLRLTSQFLGTDLLEAVSEWAKHAGDVLSNLTRAFDFLGSIAEYTSVRDLPSKMESFTADVRTATEMLVAGLKSSLGAEQVRATAEWSDAAGKVFSSLHAGFKFMEALAEYVAVSDLSGKATAFAEDAWQAVDILAAASLEVSKGAVEFATAAGQVFSSLSSAFDFLDSIRTYVSVLRLSEVVGAFAADVGLAYSVLRELGVRMASESDEIAAEWAGSAGAVFNGIQSAFSALSALSTYVTFDVAAKLGLFTSDVEVAFTALREVGLRLWSESDQTARNWAEGAGAIFSGMRSAFDFMASLSVYAGTSDRIGLLLRDVEATLPHIVALGLRLGSEGLAASREWAEGAGAIYSALSSAYSFMSSLATYVTPLDLSARIGAFTGDVLGTFPHLKALGELFGTAGLQEARGWAEGAGAIFNALSSVFRLMSGLAEYTTPVGLSAKIAAFTQDIATVYPSLKALGLSFGVDGLEVARGWAEGAGAIFSALGSVFNYMQALAGYTTPADLLARIGRFCEDVAATYPSLRDLGRRLGLEGMEVARGWAEGAGAIFNSLSSVFAYMRSLAEYVTPSNLLARIQAFTMDVAAIYPHLRALAASFGLDGIQAAREFAEGAGGIFGSLQSGFNFMRELGAYQGLTDAAIRVQTLIGDILAILPIVVDAGTRFGTEGLKAAGEWADGTGKLFSSLNASFSFLKGLAAFESVSGLADKATVFVGDVLSVLPVLVQAGKRFNMEGVEAARTWAEAIGSLMSALGSSFSFLANLGAYTKLANAQLQAQRFTEDTGTVLRVLVLGLRELQEWFEREGISVAEGFNETVTRVLSIATGSLRFLSDLSGKALHVNRHQIATFVSVMTKLLIELSGGLRTAMAAGLTPEVTEAFSGIEPAFGALGTVLNVVRGLVGQAMPDASQLDKLFTLVSYTMDKFIDLDISTEQVSRMSTLAPALESINRVLDSFLSFFDRFALGARHGNLPTQNTIRAVVDLIRWTVTSLMTGPTGLATLFEAHPEWVEVGGWLEGVTAALSSLMFGLQDALSVSVFPDALGEILGIMDAFVARLGAVSLFDIGASIVNSLAAGLLSGLGVLEGAIGAINGSLAGIVGPSLIPTEVPAMQAGGLATKKGLYLLAEKGPELVIPAGETRELLGQGVSTNVYITGPVSIRSDADIDELARQISERVGRGYRNASRYGVRTP